MNKTEQIVMRIWNSTNTANCFRTREHVVVHNGFTILLLNNIAKIDPLWTYTDTSDKYYDRCIKYIDEQQGFCSTLVNLPSLSDMRATLKGKNRNVVIPIDLTDLQFDTTNKFKGCLTVNLWYLYDLVWVLGDNVHGFWSGKIKHTKRGGAHKTAAEQGLYLCGSNGQACLMPIEKGAK